MGKKTIVGLYSRISMSVETFPNLWKINQTATEKKL